MRGGRRIHNGLKKKKGEMRPCNRSDTEYKKEEEPSQKNNNKKKVRNHKGWGGVVTVGLCFSSSSSCLSCYHAPE